MNRGETQQFSETLFIALLNNGMLRGGVFKHGDSAGRAQPEAVIVQASQPVPQLDGPRSLRVDVNLTIRSPKSGRVSAIHGECMVRLLDGACWRAAALSVGMTPDDDLDILTENISGDRNDGKQLRKRDIVVPILINKK